MCRSPRRMSVVGGTADLFWKCYLTSSALGPGTDVGHEIDGPGISLPKHCYRPRNSRSVREPTHRQLQKSLQFAPKAVARMLQLTFIYRVEWAGRFVRKDAPDGTTAD